MRKIIFGVIIFVFGLSLSFGTGILIAHFRAKQVNKEQSLIEKNKAAAIIVDSETKASSSAENLEDTLSQPESIEESIGDTSPQNSDQPSFSFAILGDTQAFDAGNPNGNLQKAVRSIATDHKDISFGFALGDLVSSCDGGGSCETKYNAWKNILSPLSFSKIYATQGNHDRTGREKADTVWQKVFEFPANGPNGYSELVYSFDFENSHFAVLDTEKPNENYVNAAQREWLERDLAANKKLNIFVIYHEPAWRTSQADKHGLDAHVADRDALWNVMNKYHVTAVFNGHDHIHTRKNIGGIYQVVVGDTDNTNEDFPEKGLSEYSYKGKMYMIVAINGQKINLELYSLEGKLINSFDFGK